MLEYSHFVTDVMGFNIFSSNSVSSLLEGGNFKVYLTYHPCSCLVFGRIGLGVFPFGFRVSYTLSLASCHVGASNLVNKI